jgi:hypothetical protein
MKACGGEILLLYGYHSGVREGLLLVLFEPKLAVVRIEEYSYNIGRIKVSLLVVLPEFLLTYVQTRHKVTRARL